MRKVVYMPHKKLVDSGGDTVTQSDRRDLRHHHPLSTISWFHAHNANLWFSSTTTVKHQNTLRVFIIRRVILDSQINYFDSIKIPLLQAFLTFQENSMDPWNLLGKTHYQSPWTGYLLANSTFFHKSAKNEKCWLLMCAISNFFFKNGSQSVVNKLSAIILFNDHIQ